MSSEEDDDDLFADSDSDGNDTDDLIAESKKNKAAASPKPIAKKKKIIKKKSAEPSNKRKRIPNADDDDSDDDLFGNGSDDDEKKPAAKKATLSKRQKMEALRAKKRRENQEQSMVSSVPKRGQKKSGDAGDNDDDDADSMDSADYVRTQEDNDFIDTEGDDAEAVKELYSEQVFDDDNEAMEDNELERKKKSGSSRGGGGKSERAMVASSADQSNPLVQAVQKLQKKKKEERSTEEMVEIVKTLLSRMKEAAEADLYAMKKKQPAVNKLKMLDEVYDRIVDTTLQRELLDEKLLLYCRLWIEPYKNNKLGNVTVRQKVISAISKIKPVYGRVKGVQGVVCLSEGIDKDHLKESGFAKTCMTLLRHPDETPAMKRELKKLIDEWARLVFGKSNNMKETQFSVRGQTGVAAIQRRRFEEQSMTERAVATPRGGEDQDMDSMIRKGSQGKDKGGLTRVRVPFSKGFAFTEQPRSRVEHNSKSSASRPDESVHAKLAKRMAEKKRPKTKNDRSANISIEGRAVK